MAVRRILLPWDSQPQDPAEGNPDLALSSIVLPGQSDFDLISGQRLSSVAATPTKGVGFFGQQLKFDSSQEGIYGTATALQKGTGAAASIVWVGELFAAPDAYAGLGGITYDGSNSNPYVMVQIKRNFASNNLFLSHSVGGSAANLTNSGVYTTGWVVIVAAVTSGRQVMYSRSVTARERVSSTVTGSMSSTATSRLEIGDSLNGRNPQASCALQAMSFRAWSNAELERILDDPFGKVFAPRSIWVPVSSGAPASYTLTAAAATYTLTGNAAAVRTSRKLTAAAGSYILTGNVAGLLHGRKLTAAAATYALTANAAILKATRKLTATAASYTWTGVAATLSKSSSYALTAAAGSYALTGNAATLRATRRLTAAAASYTFTGNAAALSYTPLGSYSLTANAAAYSLTGNAATLRASRRLSAAAGIYNLTGNAASLLRGYRLAATVQTYALTGNAAALTKSNLYRLAASVASYGWTGNAASMVYSGAPAVVRYPSRSRGITSGRITRSIKPDNFIRSITP